MVTTTWQAAKEPEMAHAGLMTPPPTGIGLAQDKGPGLLASRPEEEGFQSGLLAQLKRKASQGLEPQLTRS